MSLHHIERRGASIAYEKRGAGPAVLLVQGFGLPGGMWLRLPDELIECGFRVVVPDNRGTGQSRGPCPPFSMALLADDLAAVLRDAGAGPALCVGISLGGMIVQHLALRHPALVRGLVLAATSCGLPHGKPPHPRLLSLIPRSLRGDRRAAERLRELLVHPQSLRRDPRLFAAWDAAMRVHVRPTVQWRGIAGQLVAHALHSTGYRLGRIRCPTVVIAGEDDQILPADNARILARRIPGAELVLLREAGHVFPLEHPTALLDAIRRVAARAAEPGEVAAHAS